MTANISNFHLENMPKNQFDSGVKLYKKLLENYDFPQSDFWPDKYFNTSRNVTDSEDNNSNLAIPNETVRENMLRMLRHYYLQDCLARLLQPIRTTCGRSDNFAFKFIFPFMLILSIIGNTLALIVYRSKFLKNAPTVLLLALKALANLLGVCFLTTEMIKHYSNYELIVITGNSNVERLYWYSRPYMLFFVNYFGTLAVWCTLVITLETFLCIARPIQFRKWSQKRNVYILIAIMLILDCLHQLALPITRTVENYVDCFNTVHYMREQIRNHTFYRTYERVYFYFQSAFVICIPNLTMIILCILIVVEFQSKSISHSFSHRRRCVLRITITTTLCYCVLETPGVFVNVMAAIRGSDLEINQSWCTVSVVTNFLSISNATIPFIVYVCFNDTFRHLLIVQLAKLFGAHIEEPNNERYVTGCPESVLCMNAVGNSSPFQLSVMTRLVMSPTATSRLSSNSREHLSSGL